MYGCFYFVTGTPYTLLVVLLISRIEYGANISDAFTKSKFATVLKHKNTKAYGRVEVCDSFFYINARWWKMFKVTPRPLYLWRKSGQYPHERRLCGGAK